MSIDTTPLNEQSTTTDCSSRAKSHCSRHPIPYIALGFLTALTASLAAIIVPIGERCRDTPWSAKVGVDTANNTATVSYNTTGLSSKTFAAIPATIQTYIEATNGTSFNCSWFEANSGQSGSLTPDTPATSVTNIIAKENAPIPGYGSQSFSFYCGNSSTFPTKFTLQSELSLAVVSHPVRTGENKSQLRGAASDNAAGVWGQTLCDTDNSVGIYVAANGTLTV